MPQCFCGQDHAKGDEFCIVNFDLESRTRYFWLLRDVAHRCDFLKSYETADSITSWLSQEDSAAIVDAGVAQKDLTALRTKLRSDLPPSPPSSRFAPNQTKATEMAWTEEYRGGHVQRFCTLIRKVDITSNCRNIVAVFQSSGSGKSRLLHEVAKIIFTVPMNFRSAADPTGYPPADADARDWFFEIKETMVETKCRYMAFFAALFEEIQLRLPQLPEAGDGAAAWHLYLAENKGNLYKAARERAASLLLAPGEPDHLETFTKKACASLDEIVQWVERTSASTTGTDSTGTDSTDSTSKPMATVSVILSIDELHPLTEVITSKGTVSERTAYQVLCSVLHRFRNHKVAAVLLSTSSNLGTIAPPTRLWPSARGSAQDEPFHCPIVELFPFDEWERPFVRDNDLSLRDVGSVEHIVRFGRPLFWTRYKHGDADVRDSILSFAVAKLTGMDSGSTFSTTARLAVISTRILFTFEPNRVSVIQTENELVQNHMRVVFSVPEHREYMRTGSPSEPILAAAAARVMKQMMSIDHRIPIDLIAYALDNGLIGRGERGELVGRLLFTLARDAALLAAPSPSYEISVLDFLQALLSPSVVTDVLEATPVNQPSTSSPAPKKLKNAFVDSWIQFSHFGKAGDSSIVTAFWAWVAMARGMAWQGHNQQEEIDICIPVLVGHTSRLTADNMTALFVQVKNRTKPCKTRIDVRSFFPASNTHPYITILMELGSKQSSVVVHPTPERCNEVAVNACYALTVHGCSPATYGVIEQDEQPTYSRVLADRTLIDEHPRQNFRDDVLRLKPVWSSSSVSQQSWIEK
ncbi:hypothetical protein DFH06DRAFT_296199 [Mycena polygramma]|nr:hypothetical protein DFH06DRAFT_296199 [Mycena polygramma]